MATKQKQEAISKQQSKVLMKNMIRISVSSICFHRDILPTECFSFKPYGNMRIVQLDAAEVGPDNNIIVKNEKAFLLTQWLECGVFKALEDEFLYKMTFAIYAPHPITKAEILLETYEFKFAFIDENNPQATINDVALKSKEDIKAQAGKFIRNLVTFTQSLDYLPSENWVTIELKYTDTAPENYAPEYFKAINHSSLRFMQGADCMKLHLGAIETPSLKTDARFAGLESLLFDNLSKLTSEVATTPLAPAAVNARPPTIAPEVTLLKATGHSSPCQEAEWEDEDATALPGDGDVDIAHNKRLIVTPSDNAAMRSNTLPALPVLSQLSLSQMQIDAENHATPPAGEGEDEDSFKENSDPQKGGNGKTNRMEDKDDNSEENYRKVLDFVMRSATRVTVQSCSYDMDKGASIAMGEDDILAALERLTAEGFVKKTVSKARIPKSFYVAITDFKIDYLKNVGRPQRNSSQPQIFTHGSNWLKPKKKGGSEGGSDGSQQSQEGVPPVVAASKRGRPTGGNEQKQPRAPVEDISDTQFTSQSKAQTKKPATAATAVDAGAGAKQTLGLDVKSKPAVTTKASAEASKRQLPLQSRAGTPRPVAAPIRPGQSVEESITATITNTVVATGTGSRGVAPNQSSSAEPAFSQETEPGPGKKRRGYAIIEEPLSVTREKRSRT